MAMDQQTSKAIQRNAWTLVRAGTDQYGRRVELRKLTSGKGRAKVTMWRMYCADDQVGYGATATDAEVNYRRALNGLRRDNATGKWVSNPPDTLITICCDLCDAHGAPKVNADLSRAELIKKGWSHRNGRDFCPEHGRVIGTCLNDIEIELIKD